MNNMEILKDVGKRCNGDIYLGVVGPVRCGKSTFIKRFMELAIIPYIEDEDAKMRAIDELPQSSSGKMIMTVEPKFIPNIASQIKIDNYSVNVRFVDSVGYVIDGAKGYKDETGIRYVKTPWSAQAIPFDEAAKIGTKKVINDHSTIGIVMTCDGSICDIEKESYKKVTDEIIEELKALNKPFIIIVNSNDPYSLECNEYVNELKNKYSISVTPLKVTDMHEEDIYYLLKEALYEFKIKEVAIEVPRWIALMDSSHWLKQTLDESLMHSLCQITKFKDIENIIDSLESFEFIEEVYISSLDISTSSAKIRIKEKNDLYNEILNEILGEERFDQALFLKQMQELVQIKKEYIQYKDALKMVKQTGYGYALPLLDEIELSDPEVIKQGNRYGMKLISKASTIHMIKIDIESVFEPIIGSKQQAESFVYYLSQNKNHIYECDVFGRKLGDLINEGMNLKLHSMNETACIKVIDIMGKIVNKGKNNVIAIVL